MELFACPVCGAPLRDEGRALRCGAGHSFDRAREGYVNLLPANQKHSLSPGDDREMVRARSLFLERGYYAPLRDALCGICAARCPNGGVLVDAGCGEGWYTAAISESLADAGRAAVVLGLDISKEAVRLAARRGGADYAVASSRAMPLADGAADLLLNCFSPLFAEEFRRVLRPGGAFVYVVPAARHLWQLKAAVYDVPYENAEKVEAYDGFRYDGPTRVRGEIALDNPGDIRSLFAMTPYAWKTPAEGRARLAALTSLTTEIGFDIHCYTRV